MHKKSKSGSLLWSLVAVMLALNSLTSEALDRMLFKRKDYFIQFEVWQDDLIHFQVGTHQNPQSPIWVTPSVLVDRWNENTKYQRYLGSLQEEIIETNELLISIHPENPCWSVTEKKFHNRTLTQFCIDKTVRGDVILQMDSKDMKQVYGLGQQIDDIEQNPQLGDSWIGKKRESSSSFGNLMKSFMGGAVGDTQIPIMYALGDGFAGYGVYFDALDKLTFDFTQSPWKVLIPRSELNGFFISGPNIRDWRSDYLALTGRPLVPPRKMLGLWVSEFGFDNWEELESKMTSLKANKFPVDGFVMDLQWFGGVKGNSDDTPMGRVSWDENAFPHPAQKIMELERDQQVGLILIEESYVGKGRPEHKILADNQFLARDCVNCGPSYLTDNPWWGKGGMIDWSHPGAQRYWAEMKRKPLIDMGIKGHWTDLGEPEMFSSKSWYYGFPKLNRNDHAAIHNYFSFFWHQGIYDGYQKYHPSLRPFLLSRSSAPGSQRLGVGMWSADIGTNMKSLSGHMRSQMNMSLSGFDYYGSDVGGFHREALDGDLNTIYTQWFANSSFLDVPVRPHTENICNCKETAPDRIGHKPSNLANLRLRYQLSPYYYSLAHSAFETGEALFPPVLYHFQTDMNARNLAHEKMIGPYLLMGIVASYTEKFRSVYLPKGTWYEYYSHRPVNSQGQWVDSETYWSNEGVFRLPLYVREGAVLPLMNERITHLGPDAGVATILNIYPSDQGGNFVLTEDDGESTRYLKGEVRKTFIKHRVSGSDSYEVLISAGQGKYEKMNLFREWKIQLMHPQGRFNKNKLVKVLWNGVELRNESLTNTNTNTNENKSMGMWYQESGSPIVTVQAPKTDENKDKQLKFVYQ